MYQKTTLDNGLRLLTSYMPHTRSVSVCVFIGTGSRYETDALAGISHFIEHLLFKGTARRPTPRDISEAIEGVGGIINGGTDKELTMYWCKVAQPHFPIALDVLVDMLLNSRFDPKDMERERQVILEEISQCRDIPSQQVDMLIDEILWPNHPLGREVAGSRESVMSITSEAMIDYRQNQYVPANAVVAVAGNIEHPAATEAVSRAMGGWDHHPFHRQYVPYRKQAAPRLRIETRDTEQTHICLGLPGVSLFHPRRFTLDLLNVILGEGMSSRLFTEVRDRLGLVYSISSYVDHFLDTGSLMVSAGVDPKNLRTAISAILVELAKLRQTIPEPELSKARELSKGRLLLRMEDSRSVAGWLGGQEILAERIFTVDEIISVIDGITAEELKELARELIESERLRLAVVGPIPADEPLAELLKIE